MNALLISALLQKKAEILGEIERLEDQLADARRRTTHIDGTLASFGYESDKVLKPYHKPPPSMFRRGELVRFIFRRLRGVGPQTAVQLRDGLIGYKDLNRDDLRLKKLVHNKVLKALDRQRERGLLVRDGDLWRPR